MKYILNDKVYDIEKSTLIISYKKQYKITTPFGDYRVRKDTALYKTDIGGWFAVVEENKAYVLTEDEAKEVLKTLNQVELYTEHFEPLAEG